MDDLIIILQEIAKLSGTALIIGACALLGVLVYKLVIVGSIYTTIKFVVGKGFDALTTYTSAKKARVVVTPLGKGISKIFINTEAEGELIAQLHRVVHQQGAGSYLHSKGITWLAEAITDKRTKDTEAATPSRCRGG